MFEEEKKTWIRIFPIPFFFWKATSLERLPLVGQMRDAKGIRYDNPAGYRICQPDIRLSKEPDTRQEIQRIFLSRGKELLETEMISGKC